MQSAVWILTLLLGLCAGCSSGGARADSPGAGTDAPVEASPENSDPEPAGGTTGVDLLALQRDYRALNGFVNAAQTELANECMLERGFPALPVVLPPQWDDLPVYTGDIGRLELDEDAARSDGYDAAPNSALGTRVDPREEAQRSLDRTIYDDAWGEAWHGPIAALPDPGTTTDPTVAPEESRRGCYRLAGDALDGQLAPDQVIDGIQTLDRLWNGVYSLTDSDERFLGAQAAWSRCMQSRGYEFSSLGDAYSTGMQMQETDPVGSVEQAINDAQCQSESEVIEVHASVWREHEQTVASSDEALAFATWHRENYADIVAEVETLLDVTLTDD